VTPIVAFDQREVSGRPENAGRLLKIVKLVYWKIRKEIFTVVTAPPNQPYEQSPDGELVFETGL
jgi:hypothetical protein